MYAMKQYGGRCNGLCMTNDAVRAQCMDTTSYNVAGRSVNLHKVIILLIPRDYAKYLVQRAACWPITQPTATVN